MDFYLAAIIQAFCFGPLVLGLFLSMKVFNIPDITTDGSYTLGAVMTGIGLSQGYPIVITFLMAMLAGGLAGCCTGLIHTKLRVHPLLAGILVMTALYSVNLTLLGRSNMPLLGYDDLFASIRILPNTDDNTLLLVLLLLLLVFLGMGYMLRSDFGIAMRATGDSESMIRAQGVNTTRMKIFGLAISNSLVALSGFLMGQFQGFVDINMGIGIVISGLGAVAIGETLITVFKINGNAMKLACVIIGALVFQIILAIALQVGVNPNLLKLTTAVLVLILVGLPQIGNKWAMKR